MNDVKVLDKEFTLSISESDLQARIASLGTTLNKDYKGRDPLVVSVLNGSFLFTADLVRHLDWDPEIQFIRVSSYKGGMSSSGEMQILLDLKTPIQGKDILLVEDIVDTGNTLEWLRTYMMNRGAASVNLITLLFKEEAFQAKTPPEYIGFNIPNEFVVGYGMDYAEHGRSLPAVYTLKS